MRRQFLLPLLLLALTGCGTQEPLNSPQAAADTNFAKSIIFDLQSRDLADIAAKLDPKALTAATEPTLSRLAASLPTRPANSVQIAEWSAVSFKGKIQDISPDSGGKWRRAAISLQYQFGDAWFLETVQWRTPEGGTPVIEDFKIEKMPASLEEINRFTVSGKALGFYLVLAAVAADLLFTLAVLIICLRTSLPWLRKSLWAAAIVLGVGQLTCDWTTGTVWGDLFSIHVPVADWGRAGPLGPYLFNVSFPLFAIIFLIMRCFFRFRARIQDTP